MNTQKRMAAEILKCGKTSVWIDPTKTEEVAGAMTRGDIKKFIGLKFIKAMPKAGNSRARIRKKKAQRAKGRGRGFGKRRGTANARMGDKEKWMKKIRAQRSLLRKLKGEQKISVPLHRRAYLLSKAGTFKSRAYLITYLRENPDRL